MKNTDKYRPSLTSAQIEHILTLAKGSPMTDVNINLIGILSPFYAKIQNKALTVAYTTTEKQSTLASIGGTSSPNLADNKEQYWQDCHQKLTELGPANCSLEEIQAANEHRYLHGLMTPDEQAAFERGEM